jgi:hypothetical protein
MSALSDLKGVSTQVDVRILGPYFWKWYHKHANDLIVKRKILIFSVTIRVRDLRVLFEQLFGPEPANLDIAGL